MIVAKEKKSNNIAEYVLYMWQIEDILRAYDFDIEKIDEHVISRYSQSEETMREIRNWYLGLIDLMLLENIRMSGHLPFVQNTVNELYELHTRLLADSRFAEYQELYHRALPNIQEFSAKVLQQTPNDIETCFNGLYALLLLRLQKKEISPDTLEAMNTFSTMLALLAKFYHDAERGELEL